MIFSASSIIIYLLLPLAGLIHYLIYSNKYNKQTGTNIGAELFVLYFNVGGALTVFFTVIFWEWSGMASLGFFYLVLVAPISSIIALRYLYKKQVKLADLKELLKSALWLILLFFVVLILNVFIAE